MNRREKLIVDTSDRAVQHIVSKLHFIGKIDVGQKVDVKTLKLWNDNYVTSAYRTFIARGESRAATLEFFSSIFEDAYTLIEYFFSQKDRFSEDTKGMLIDALKTSRIGIKNIKITYNDDTYFSAEINTLLRTLNFHLAKYGENITYSQDLYSSPESE